MDEAIFVKEIDAGDRLNEEVKSSLLRKTVFLFNQHE